MKRPPIRRTTRVKGRNAPRKAKEFARAYGSAERVAWVKAMGCAVCGLTPSENAHTVSGGMGRKADAATIAPLCRSHHREYHTLGSQTFGQTYRIDLEAVAANVERSWQRVAAPHTPTSSEDGNDE